jgi:hypothetical protein
MVSGAMAVRLLRSAHRRALIAIHGHLTAPGTLRPNFEFVPRREQTPDRVAVSGLERHKGGVYDALILTAESLSNQVLQLLGIKVKDRGDQSKNENILALILCGTAERLNSEPCYRNPHINEAFVIQIRLNLIRVKSSTPPLFKSLYDPRS